MKKKKTIRTQRVKIFKMIDRMAWLIPALLLIWFYFGWSIQGVNILEFFQGSLWGSIVIVIMVLFSVACLSAPIMLIWKAITRALKKSAIQNATFNVLEDFDYYRDKLTGLSPSDISMLTDLEIELKKDITALILKYVMLGVVTIENGIISVINLNHPDLLESDRFLLHTIEAGSITSSSATQWVQMAKTESVGKGYLIDTRGTGEIQKKRSKGCLSALLTGCVTPIIIWIAIPLMVGFLAEGTLTYLDSTIVHLKELTPDASNADFAKALTGNPTEVFQLFILLCSCLILIAALLLPVVSLIFYLVKSNRTQFYKRSALGEELTEQIYGMKNFIHDFSDLSHANKEQLVLWDDFLIYAVLLEENMSIVNEICSMKHMDINGIYRAAQF